MNHIETSIVEKDVENLVLNESNLTDAAENDLHTLTEKNLAEKDLASEQLLAETQKAAAAMAAEDARIRKAEREALAQKIAAKKKQSELEAQARAEALSKAQQQAQQQAQEEMGKSNLHSVGTKPESESSKNSGSSISGVRALADLKQMPGNKRPEYDEEDRLNNRKGDVTFIAYVSKEGKLVNFKLLQSSGHRKLDKKAFQAIKSWKFYPGQEGWVEIPLNWNLKGGPKEKTTTLRRSSMVQTKTISL